MKAFVFTFLLVAVGAHALPQQHFDDENSDSGIRANVFGNRVTAELSGTLATQTSFIGDIRFNIGIISGISVRTVDNMKFRIENIQSNLSVSYQGEDYSDQWNTVMNEVILRVLEENREPIDKFLSDLVLKVVNEALGRNMITEDQVLIA